MASQVLGRVSCTVATAIDKLNVIFEMNGFTFFDFRLQRIMFCSFTDTGLQRVMFMTRFMTANKSVTNNYLTISKETIIMCEGELYV